ncbi:MAG TPA: STAS domain-containing protein [Phycisphaerae bacterium]|nr:STAS domain-containing protein [Phycisphaerae bacterium]HRY67423.1 STAS domain-containing protein [Phycisphaerae bacterium]HSA28986.1 STAS domain-containing protein [Phycisphaerae bacterium]
MPEVEASLTIRKQDSISVVEFEDRKILEEVVIGQILEKLTGLVAAEPVPKVLLSFRKVEHMSSAALGVLITVNKQIAERHGQLVLANIHPQIYEVFKITRLNRLFNIQSTTDAAVRAFV